MFPSVSYWIKLAWQIAINYSCLTHSKAFAALLPLPVVFASKSDFSACDSLSQNAGYSEHYYANSNERWHLAASRDL